MRPLKKILASLLRVAFGVPIVSLIVCGLLFFAFSETLRGRSVGLSAAILGAVLFCSVSYWRRACSAAAPPILRRVVPDGAAALSRSHDTCAERRQARRPGAQLFSGRPRDIPSLFALERHSGDRSDS